MSTDLNTSAQGQRVWQFKNMTNPPETIPAYAVMARAELKSGDEKPDPDRDYLDYWGWGYGNVGYTVRPMQNGTLSNQGGLVIGARKCLKVHRLLQNPHAHFFNLGKPVPPGGIGECTFDFPALAQINNDYYPESYWYGWGTGQQVAVVDGYGYVGNPTCGVHENSWALQFGYDAFSIFSGAMSSRDRFTWMVTPNTKKNSPRLAFRQSTSNTQYNPGDPLPIQWESLFWSDLGERINEDTGGPAPPTTDYWWGNYGWYLVQGVQGDNTKMMILAPGFWIFDITFVMGSHDVDEFNTYQAVQMLVSNKQYPDGRGVGFLGIVEHYPGFDFAAPATVQYNVETVPAPDHITLPAFIPRWVNVKMNLGAYLQSQDVIQFKVVGNVGSCKWGGSSSRNNFYGWMYRVPQ